MKNLFKIFCILFTILITNIDNLKALHIIGGDVVYKCLGVDSVRNLVSYQITFTMYRDTRGGGAQLDPTARFGVYRGFGGSWVHVRTVANIPVMDISDVDINSLNPCILVPVNVGVQKGTYVFEVDLPISSESYLISYQRCCRNTTILNLNNPGRQGAAFTTEISPMAQQTCNNSPVFKEFPPVVICVNRPINFDHSAKDVDGDSLVYEFCTPLQAGGTDGATTPGSAQSCTGVTPNPQTCPPPYDPVAYADPYSSLFPISGDPAVWINASTGVIDGMPNITGQFVVGVCVKEYRNGELIGTLRRDFQFNITVCELAVRADIKATTVNNGVYKINSCGPQTVNFDNLSTDTRYIRSYLWEFDLNNGIKSTTTTRNTTVTFPGVGKYNGRMILNNELVGFDECKDTAFLEVNVFPSITADFTFRYDTCRSSPIAFTNNAISGAGPIQKYSWWFDQEGISQLPNPSFEFENPGKKRVQFRAEDSNKCVAEITKEVNYFPLPNLIVIEPNTYTGCKPASIFFNNLSKPIDDTYKFDWDFGDGKKGTALSPTNLYTDEGLFTVRLNLTSPIGCTTTKTWPNLIRIVPSPTAGFTFTPEEPNLQNNLVSFIDQSIGAVSYQWLFDSIGTSLERNPTYLFRDTGVFVIQQIVRHLSGCTDTASAVIPMFPLVKLLMPNAFTPNDDGLNDVFIPAGLIFGVRNYNFSIWNRWGEQFFVTNDPSVGWNGQRNNQGDTAPPGVYVYKLEYIDPRGDKQLLKGYCTLLR